MRAVGTSASVFFCLSTSGDSARFGVWCAVSARFACPFRAVGARNRPRSFGCKMLQGGSSFKAENSRLGCQMLQCASVLVFKPLIVFFKRFGGVGSVWLFSTFFAVFLENARFGHPGCPIGRLFFQGVQKVFFLHGMAEPSIKDVNSRDTSTILATLTKKAKLEGAAPSTPPVLRNSLSFGSKQAMWRSADVVLSHFFVAM